MKSSIKFESVLKEHLDNPEQAAKYLTACYEEGQDVFLQGLWDVVDARCGMSHAARLAGLNRESLYRQLSRRGNPSLASLSALLSALGLKLRFAAQPPVSHMGAGKNLATGKPLSPERVPAEEWKGYE